MLDICKPIGYLFLIIGSILIIYALVDPQISTLEIVGDVPKSITFNLNLPCGISMLLFSMLMLWLAYGNKTAPGTNDQSNSISENK